MHSEKHKKRLPLQLLRLAEKRRRKQQNSRWPSMQSRQVFLRAGSRKRPCMPAGTLKHGHKNQHSDCVYADRAMRTATNCTTQTLNNQNMHKATGHMMREWLPPHPHTSKAIVNFLMMMTTSKPHVNSLQSLGSKTYMLNTSLSFSKSVASSTKSFAKWRGATCVPV